MSAFTKRPWVTEGFRVYGPPDSRSKHRNGRALIGGVVDDGIDWQNAPFDGPEARGAFYAEAKANLALFRASPELFEALDVLVYWHDQGHIDESWWDAARAAIAEANPKP